MISLLTMGERPLVIYKAQEEVGHLYQENLAETLEPNVAILRVDPGWNPNDRYSPGMEHYRRCILAVSRRQIIIMMGISGQNYGEYCT